MRDSDATVIFSGMPLKGGSALTAKFCREQEKPFMIVRPFMDPDQASDMISSWALEKGVNTLNVAGHRESKCKGLERWVQDVIRKALST